jgi:tRNA wybutosine-synthesizing protein 1
LLWHTHRALILLSVFALAAAVRLSVYVRGRREKVSISPAPSSPSDEKKTIELKPEWLPENTTLVAPPLNLDNHAEDDVPAVATVVKPRKGPKTVKGKKAPKKAAKVASDYDHTVDKIQPLVFFQSIGGTTERRATQLAETITEWTTGCDQSSSFLKPQLLDLADIEFDDYFITPPKPEPNTKYFYFILLPTYNIDTLLDAFIENLSETHNDFRIDTAPLSGLLGYSVFGFGDKEGWPTEEEGFCSQAREVDKWMARLTGRKRAYPLGMGDIKGEAEARLAEWRLGVQEALVEMAEGRGLGEGVLGSGDPLESDEEDMDEEDNSDPEPRVDDVEDLGTMVNGSDAPIPVDFTTYKSKPKVKSGTVPKEMVPKSSPTHAALTKQGYSIIGSHSGVKICRWTKSALRGRGSCYKYSFYGIASHLCMEATPSLSCSNKCVFCWRHGTNPVGTTWRWITDAPDVIFDGITAAHYKKIKMMKGVPGVRAERFAEAMRIRHCALSLVGEPIFYPHINELLHLMHKSRISTFLVCNAQHPAQLASLIPVTQLYVSIDASNKDSLRKIDRPLHRDFWERFCACLDILRTRRFEQRTVFRLTLVKGFNMAEEVKGYADLVERALPCFVEVKGVTYCGTSAAGSAGLTMQNVPFYEEVAEFVTHLEAELNTRGLSYGIGAEHAHSCCVLLADRTRFKPNGKWATRIDFERFFDLYEGKVQGSRMEDGKVVGWRPEDYVGAETPEWALWGNGGFDPRDQRVYRKGKGPKNEGEAASSPMAAVAAKKAALEF